MKQSHDACTADMFVFTIRSCNLFLRLGNLKSSQRHQAVRLRPLGFRVVINTHDWQDLELSEHE